MSPYGARSYYWHCAFYADSAAGSSFKEGTITGHLATSGRKWPLWTERKAEAKAIRASQMVAGVPNNHHHHHLWTKLMSSSSGPRFLSRITSAGCGQWQCWWWLFDQLPNVLLVPEKRPHSDGPLSSLLASFPRVISQWPKPFTHSFHCSRVLHC